MNKEEQEAIKEAKKLIEEEAHNLNDINVFMTDSTTLKILLNLIDKLLKENEELKKQLKVNNTFNIKESEVRTPRYIESTTLKRWWLE